MCNDDDCQELKTWCRLHWLHTICKSVQNSNAPVYDDCCISFSRKGFVNRISHPLIQSASVLKIPSLRKVNSPEELYDWPRERMMVHLKLEKKLYFPSINMPTSHQTTRKTRQMKSESQSSTCPNEKTS